MKTLSAKNDNQSFPGALKNFVNCIGKHLCWSLILIKLQAPTQVPVKFAKSLRTSFFTEHFQWLLLN